MSAHETITTGAILRAQMADIVQEKTATLRRRIDRLTERCDAYKRQVEAGAVRIEVAEKRAAELTRLIEHIWLHVISDEDFDADEMKRDIENTGSVDELKGTIVRAEAAEKRIAELEGENAKLARERDEAVDDRIDRFNALNTATLALSDLRTAIAPFAAYAKRELDKTIPRHIQDDPHTPVLASGAWDDRGAVEICVGDFQRLAALSQDLTLSPVEQDGPVS